MVEIIDGKKYDTNKSIRIDTYSNEDSRSNFNWYDEELYVSKKGNYFLYAYANNNFPYSDGNGISPWGMERIIPFSKEEAFIWCQSRKRTETILRHF